MLVPYMNHDPWLLKDYYRPCTKRDGSRGWSGGRDLQSSADFTKVFCNKLLHCWLDAQGVQWMLGLDSVRIPNVSTLKCVMEGLDWAWWLTFSTVQQLSFSGAKENARPGRHRDWRTAFEVPVRVSQRPKDRCYSSMPGWYVSWEARESWVHGLSFAASFVCLTENVST